MSDLRVLFLGDICGKPGRQVLKDNLASIKREKKIDLVIANVENIAHGRGATKKTFDEIANAGVDLMTGGNHIFRMSDIYDYLEDESKNLIRPANYEEDIIGRGELVADLGKKGRILLISIIGKFGFESENITDPYRAVDRVLDKYKEEEFAAIIVDFHAEATSEKVAMGWYLDSRVSAVIGTHTHVPTADERVLPGGTAHISDVGMVGPRDSVLWVEKEKAIEFQKYPYPVMFDVEEEGEKRLDGVIVQISSKNKAKSIERLNLVYS